MLTFRYKVSSEKKMDLLRFYLDGERLEKLVRRGGLGDLHPGPGGRSPRAAVGVR